MNEYEVFIEDINSCGGEKYAKKELIEVEAKSPEDYVKLNGRFPILEISKNSNWMIEFVKNHGWSFASSNRRV